MCVAQYILLFLCHIHGVPKKTSSDFAISAIPQNPVIRLRKTALQALGYKSVKTGDFIVFKFVPLFFSYRHANLSYKAAKLFECAKIAKLTKLLHWK